MNAFTMSYEIKSLPFETLFSTMAMAEDRLARLDEIVRFSPVGEGAVERGHFRDAVAAMWVSGELVHIEDLVLHDAHMDIRAPTHELTIAHAILRTRRRIAINEPGWALSNAGIDALTRHKTVVAEASNDLSLKTPKDTENSPLAGDNVDLLAIEIAKMDEILNRSQQLLERDSAGGTKQTAMSKPLIVGDLLLRDSDWDEPARLLQWKELIKKVEGLPITLGAALIYDAWESLEPLQNQHWIGAQLVGGYLRAKGKVSSHLLSFNVGLRTIPRDRRRSQSRTIRLLAFLSAMTAAAEISMKEIIRLTQAREQMQRRLEGRRSSSSLPIVIDLILSRPIVSTAMIAKEAKLTPRGALNLIAELGVRELTGRGRYRGWGVI